MQFEVAAAAIKAGINLDCSSILQNDVIKAIEQGLLTEKEVDQRLFELLRTEFKLGFYDEQATNPYHTYGADSVHNACAYSSGQKSGPAKHGITEKRSSYSAIKQSRLSQHDDHWCQTLLLLMP